MHNLASAFFQQIFEESIVCKQNFLQTCSKQLITIANTIVNQLKLGNKILLFGNGGSAADAQHLAAEFVNRLLLKRPAIPALALTTDTSVITSIANDFDFSDVFARQIEAFGVTGDIAMAITTSGNSPNIAKALKQAGDMKLIRIGLFGGTGGICKSLVDHALIVPSTSAQRIQETHITIGHALCEWVEKTLFSE